MSFIIGTPYARGAGYFRNDDRPAGGTKAEADVLTCPHCQAVIKMQQWDVVDNGGKGGGWCSRCFAPTCRACAKRMRLYGCEPFMKQLEAQMELGLKYAGFLKLAGMEPARPTQQIITGL
jgi:hypothetical protein